MPLRRERWQSSRWPAPKAWEIKRVEADEEAFSEKGEDHEDAGGNADSGDGGSAVGKATDHHGVDDDHAHPADFGEDEREGEAKGGAKFVAEGGEGEHGGARRV